MCGRFTLSASGDSLAELFNLDHVPGLRPRYNIAPAQEIAAVRLAPQGTREVAMLRWGLVPSWAKDASIGSRMINARSETAAEKPAFRTSFRHRRCLVPADGFYEWAKTGAKKQPYLFRRGDGRPFAIAALWESWADPDGHSLETCTLLTTGANRLVAGIHPRMPVIVDPMNFNHWLSPPNHDPRFLQPLLRPYGETEMIGFPVSSAVNRSDNDSPQCTVPLSEVLGLGF